MKASFASALTAALVIAVVSVLSDDVSPAAQSGDGGAATTTHSTNAGRAPGLYGCVVARQ